MAKIETFTISKLDTKNPHDMVSAKVAEFPGGQKAMRIEVQAGFHWTKCMKEKMGTDFCQAEHFGYIESGHMCVSMGSMDGGQKMDIRAGDFYHVPPGHDAVTMEPTVMMEFSSLAVSMYGKDIK